MIRNKEDLKRLTESFHTHTFDELVEQYVPDNGKAETLAGELLRAVLRIDYRYYNDGDKAGEGYGKETVNPAVRFLIAKGDDNVSSIANSLFALSQDDMYEFAIKELKEFVVVQIEEGDLTNTPNEEDMLSYGTEEDIDDEEY